MRLNEVDLNGDNGLTFRFRSIDTMLKHDELKNLEMYFCPFEMEDDAFEGALNLYWKGDEILWDNFIGHYFVVFYVHYVDLILSEEEERRVPDKINWWLFRSDMDMESLISDLLKKPVVKMVKDFVMAKEHKVDGDELRLYLNFLHPSVLEVIWQFIGDQRSEIKYEQNIIDYEKELAQFNWEKAKEQGIFRILNQIHEKKKRESDLNKLSDWQRWLLKDFPDDYFNALGEMVFPKWYIVSFCRNCTNTRNWAQYGDSNRGVCLIYRMHQGPLGRGLRLKTCQGYSTGRGKIIANHIEKLHNVKYSSERPALNFFEMLGCIPRKMKDEWFHDRKGNVSSYYVKDDNDPKKENWRRQYWKMFNELVSQKGEDWDGLEEERMVLENSILVDYENEPSERKIRYDFEELKGIIWGCNVKDDKKKEVRDIIDELCEKNGRTDFEFYQAVKDPSSHKIWIEKEVL